MSNTYLRKKERVFLPSDELNPDEYGYVLEGPDNNGVFVVQVDQQYITDPGDDGIREVTSGQFQRIGGQD